MRHREQGTVLVLVLTILAALFAAGAAALFLQLSSTRNAGLIRTMRSSLFCAEAGLVASRPVIGINYPYWNRWLDTDPTNNPTVPAYPLTGDIDGDGVNDYEVTIRDNDDELPPLNNDPTVDNDLKVFVVSRCIKHSEVQREVLELVVYTSAGGGYRDMGGHSARGTGNAN